MFYFSYYFFSLDIKIFKYPTKKEIFTIFIFFNLPCCSSKIGGGSTEK